jgi:PAS domain S-box-containing protein
MLHADFGNIQLFNPQTQALEIVAQRGFRQEFLDYFNRVAEGTAFCGTALQRRERVIVEDVQTDPLFAPHLAIVTAAGYRAVQSTPLFSRSGKPLGILSTHFRQPHRPSERELRLTDLYARQAAEMIERELAEGQLQAETAERQYAEEELRKIVAIVENSPDFIGFATPEDQVLFVNPAGQALVGLAGDEDVRRTKIIDYVAPQERSRLQEHMLPLLLRDGRWEGEMLFRHFQTGALIPMWQDNFVIMAKGSQRPLVLATISRDLTERRRAEQARQQLLQQLDSAEEEERRRISRELHDSLGQYLTALQLGLKSIEAQDGCPAPVRDGIQQMRQLALRIDEEVERLSFELHPPALDDLGLADALRRHVQQWSVTSGIVVDLHLGGLDHERLPPFVETTLYRIVQEALTNVVKHAGVARVSLIIERRRAEVIAIIEDNGRGFDLAAAEAAPRRFGLKSMAERAALAGGRLDIETAPGSGTTIYIHIPLQTDQDEGG